MPGLVGRERSRVCRASVVEAQVCGLASGIERRVEKEESRAVQEMKVVLKRTGEGVRQGETTARV